MLASTTKTTTAAKSKVAAKPTDTAIKKAKNELVQEVATIMGGKLKELRAGRHCVFTSTANLNLKNPTVKIEVKYFGSWSYCPKRERMHIQSFEEQQLKHEVDQLLERYPKFSIEWNTDDKSILSVIVKNQQPPTLAMLKGGLTPAQQKVENAHLENMATIKKVAAEIRRTLKAGKNGGKPRRATSGFGIGGSRGTMGFEAGNEWYENINDKGEVDIGCRDLGGDYQVPREGGHDYYSLEMSDSTEKFVNDTVAAFNKKYPKLDIGWSADEKRWMSVYISVKKSKKP